jgi:FMN phosphatase YigB (HAD superfamily)/DNA-binding Xre family transcriptional regulator
MNEKGLGLSVGEARRAAGLTQQELCQKTGLSYSTLAKIERGAIKSPSVFTIQQIAEALDQPIGTILGDDGGGTPKPAKKRSKSGVEFVYFDVNGCLVRFFHRAFTSAAQDTGVPADQVESVFWHYNDAACRGEMSMDAFNSVLAEKLHLKKIDWAEYYIKAVEPVPDTAELVGWTAKHYRCGLLSNIMPGLIDKLISRKLIPNENYDSIIDSSEIGAIKPEAKIYQAAAQKAKVQPEEILLVDDSRANVMAAEKCGWKVLWFDDYRPAESIARVKKTLEF